MYSPRVCLQTMSVHSSSEWQVRPTSVASSKRSTCTNFLLQTLPIFQQEFLMKTNIFSSLTSDLPGTRLHRRSLMRTSTSRLQSFWERLCQCFLLDLQYACLFELCSSNCFKTWQVWRPLQTDPSPLLAESGFIEPAKTAREF